MMLQSETDIFPVYVSFPTFQSAINNLRDHGLPPKLDRSAWPSRSGAEQGQIVSALKFLGLIDKDGNTQQALRDFVSKTENSDDEKRLLGELLKTRYQSIFSGLDLKSATPKQLEDAIGQYGPTGATRDRAIRFFVKAAEHAKVPLSPWLTRKLRSRTSTPFSNGEPANKASVPPKVRRRKRGSESETKKSGNESYSNAMKTVTLRLAGGELALSGTFNALELEGDERKLVYDIVDLMKKYERGGTPSDAVAGDGGVARRQT
jgi:Family of unknown function (DUF5343)